MSRINLLNRVIEFSFYGLFFLVPLAFTSSTSELFEFNKLWLTFALTIVIGTAWFLKMILTGEFRVQRTPLDIPIALFFGALVLSTIFSWDRHVSLWGYYSRFNGGLVSMATYIFLYYAFVSNFRFERAKENLSLIGKRAVFFLVAFLVLSVLSFVILAVVSEPTNTALFDYRTVLFRSFLFVGLLSFVASIMSLRTTPVMKILYASLFSGVLVALWGLPSHFGYDPTCFLFRGSLDVACWTEQFQPKMRIFSTLGQPGWLAAYLALLIPIVIAMSIKYFDKGKSIFSKTNLASIAFMGINVLFLVDLLYTRTRGGFLGILISFIALLALLGFISARTKADKLSILGLSFLNYLFIIVGQIVNSPLLAIIGSVSFFTFLISIFAIAIKNKKTILNEKLIPVASSIAVFLFFLFMLGTSIANIDKLTWPSIKQSLEKNAPAPTPAAPHIGELGGTDSGKIRLIVWRGALSTWVHNPVFGTGVETFAFAYYKYKPAEHNKTSEWNFLYNKAHNEFLNYLATTGIVGLGTYLLVIGLFLSSFSILFFNIKKGKVYQGMVRLGRIEPASEAYSLAREPLSIALVASYISILITNFFGFSVVITNVYLFMIPAFLFLLIGLLSEKKTFGFTRNSNKTDLSPTHLLGALIVILLSLFLLFFLAKAWIADTKYALGSNLDRVGQYQQAYPSLSLAVTTRPDEPVFKDEFSLNQAALAVGLAQQGATESASVAQSLAESAVTTSSELTKKYPKNIVFWKSRVRILYTIGQYEEALTAIKEASKLAPNDASINYNLGVLYGQNGDSKKAVEVLEKAVVEKPDYQEAHYALGIFYHDLAVDKNDRVINQTYFDKAVNEMRFILKYISPADQRAKEALTAWNGGK